MELSISQLEGLLAFAKGGDDEATNELTSGVVIIDGDMEDPDIVQRIVNGERCKDDQGNPQMFALGETGVMSL